jgi:hypothetical protein
MFISSPFRVPASLRVAGPCRAMRLLTMRTVRIEASQPGCVIAWLERETQIAADVPGAVDGPLPPALAGWEWSKAERRPPLDGIYYQVSSCGGEPPRGRARLG